MHVSKICQNIFLFVGNEILPILLEFVQDFLEQNFHVDIFRLDEDLRVQNLRSQRWYFNGFALVYLVRDIIKNRFELLKRVFVGDFHAEKDFWHFDQNYW